MEFHNLSFYAVFQGTIHHYGKRCIKLGGTQVEDV